MSKTEILLAALWVGAGIVVGFAAWTMVGPTVVSVKNNIIPIKAAA